MTQQEKLDALNAGTEAYMDQNTQEEVSEINGQAYIEEPETAEYRKRSQKLSEMALDNALGLQVLLSREIQKYFDPSGAPSYKKLSDESSAILANLATASKNALCEH